ncbi:MAG: cation transporter [Acetatifactor sp.]|nr:cation transporter [Acetatifactor sp.]
MENAIIILTLIVIAVLAIKPTIKHFKGSGGCCGGGDYQPKKKKLGKIIQKKTFQVKGMHCEHCCRRVEEAVNEIAGVSAQVKLKKGIVIVSYEKPVDDGIIVHKIEKAGYQAELFLL